MKLKVFVAACILFCMVSLAHADAFWRKVTWTTVDGIQMTGQYHRSRRAGAYTWVLLHGLGSIKEEWDPFARQLARQGNGIFVYDARGHGQSNATVSGTPLTYKDWGIAGPGSPWDAMPGDLESAVTVVHNRFEIPLARIAVGGASLGANVALVYASRQTSVPALILLSPGLEYAGIQSQSSFQAYGKRPLFMAASPEDSYAYSSVRQLTSLRNDSNFRVAEGPGSAHGVQMFKDTGFTHKLLQWMKTVERK